MGICASERPSRIIPLLLILLRQQNQERNKAYVLVDGDVVSNFLLT
jgi:hypothetical protein